MLATKAMKKSLFFWSNATSTTWSVNTATRGAWLRSLAAALWVPSVPQVSFFPLWGPAGWPGQILFRVITELHRGQYACLLTAASQVQVHSWHLLFIEWIFLAILWDRLLTIIDGWGIWSSPQWNDLPAITSLMINLIRIQTQDSSQ